jgi:hypothetical protein
MDCLQLCENNIAEKKVRNISLHRILVLIGDEMFQISYFETRTSLLDTVRILQLVQNIYVWAFYCFHVHCYKLKIINFDSHGNV